MLFVLDASATLPWCFQDEATAISEALLSKMIRGDAALVPAHWPTEVLSSLLRGKRRGRVSDQDIDFFLLDLGSFSITVAPGLEPTELIALKRLSERLGLSPYDAAYLNLAHEAGLPLATTDTALSRACQVEGVMLV